MNKRYLIGVDVGGTNVDALLVDESVNNLAFMTTPIRPKNGAKPITVIIELIEALIVEANITNLDEIQAIGVGAPGLVNAKTGVVELAVNLDEKSMNLGSILKEKFGCQAFIENDANAVALGAARFLVNSSVQHLAFYTIGTGVGAGLVLNGQIFHGATNLAGEIGHIYVQENEIDCQCGANGCLETFVAGPAIRRMASNAINSGLLTSLSKYDAPDAAAVFTEADAGDSVASEIVKDVCLILARSMHSMMMSFDLEKIIIGGGISRAGNSLLQPILDEWERLRDASVLANSLLQPDRLMMCPPDFKAGAWGAVAVALAGTEKSNVLAKQQKEPMGLTH